MFSGIINHTGKVSKLISDTKGIDLYIFSQLKFKKNEIGLSISCDGVCLTLVSYKKKISRFYISNETMIRSKFKTVKILDKINLELPIKFENYISGHFVQGHVDTVGKVIDIKKIGKSKIIKFYINKKFIKELVNKASITINGVSLTISKLTNIFFEISIIPHTLKSTNLISLSKGDLVNIEIDILSKYVKKFLI
jgi:riboflavin synthase|tara:strand:+ start:3432 stop:4016 length:585 start_codon:yes stop_codon:yes gene_type:complete